MKIKGFSDTKSKNPKVLLETAYFDVEEIESVTEWAVRLKVSNRYFCEGELINYIVIAKYGKSAKALPKNIDDLKGNEIDIKAENVDYRHFYDYKEHVIIVDKYTVVM